jgi:hypothetical protein
MNRNNRSFQTKKLEGNDRFEGFAIDLMTEIAKFLQFNISFKLVDDGMVRALFSPRPYERSILLAPQLTPRG